MENLSISELIKCYKDGEYNMLSEICRRMLPLIKKYAQKTHFMEFEDSCQEYSLALIEAVTKIKRYETDGQCLAYLTVCIKNKFCSLFKNYNQTLKNELVTDIISEENIVYDNYADIIFLIDIQNFINSLSSEKKRNIAFLDLIEQKTDSKIAGILNISRQYVNRTKRELYELLKNNG